MINSSKIKERMNELSVSQKQIASALGIAAPTVSQKINNVRPVTLEEEGEKIMSEESKRVATIEVEVDTTQLDVAIEKTNQLAELLAAAQKTINSQVTVGPFMVNGQAGTDQVMSDIVKKMRIAVDGVCLGEKNNKQVHEELGIQRITDDTADALLVNGDDDHYLSAKKRIDMQNAKIKRVALNLLGICECEGLSVWEFNQVMETMASCMQHKVIMGDQPKP